MPPASANLLRELNSEQVQAATHGEGPLLIVAGAGTGKTTVLTKRMAWLIEQGKAESDQLLALTFTDKAATEMEERVDRLLPLGYVNIWVSTFHSFCERVLKDWALEIGLPNDFRVLTATEQWMLVRANLEKFNLDYYRPLGNPTRFIHALLTHFSRAKDETVYPEGYLAYAESRRLDTGSTEFLKKGKKRKLKAAAVAESTSEEAEAVRLMEVAQAYHVYQQLLLEQGAFDFGDLINYCLKLFRERPRVLAHYQEKFRYVLVDEFQDTNYAQYELIKLLAKPNNNLTVVGDDDQSVYKFRGASISNILEFKADYPEAKGIFLTQNYRSHQNILDTAYEFIQLNNPYRLEVRLAKNGQNLSKKLVASRQGQGLVENQTYGTGEDEAMGVVREIIALQHKTDCVWSDFAILVRANAQAAVFLQALKRAKVPFDYVASKGLYNEGIVLDVVAYLKLLDSYHESEALYRVLTREPFALPQPDLSAVLAFAKKYTLSLYEAVKKITEVGISQAGQGVVFSLLASLEKHAEVARTKPASEVYVRVVNDLGINARLVHPALVREAQYLTALYKRLQHFEQETSDTSLSGFLKYLSLELEAGEEGALPTDTEEGPETVKVTTVHAAKGLEWKYVFIPQLVDRRFPSTERREAIELPRELIKEQLPEGDVHLQEERRLFYVALTRARDGLYLSRATDYLGKTTRKPSRFLYELGLVSEEEYKAKTEKLIVEAPQVISPKVPAYPLPESFSFSSVSSFKKCPLEYKFAYLLKLPMPGAAQLSFGSTMHKTFEQFLKLWQVRAAAVQGDLFGGAKSGKVELPTFAELKQLYDNSWIDEWYESKIQKQEYREKRGLKQLKNFYDKFVEVQPKVSYLEKFFKIGMGDHKFVGKIDRIDESASGGVIIDYKTGGTAATTLEKVDKDQLIIYQIAAQEFLGEKISCAKYWYLEPNRFSDDFMATPEQILRLKSEYTAVIEEIIRTVQTDSFVAADEAVRHECEYKHLI